MYGHAMETGTDATADLMTIRGSDPKRYAEV